MSTRPETAAGIRSIGALAPTILHLAAIDVEREDARRAADRGYFRPDEEERLRAWFATYLTARAGLLETIDELRPLVSDATLDPGERLRGFVVGYTGACLLVKAARFLVAEFATHRVVQRKLNEADPAHRIPRKQFTRTYRSLTSPRNAYRLLEAMEWADRERAAIEAIEGDAEMAPVVAALRASEDALRVDLARYVRSRLRYRWHSYRRRRASAAQQALFAVLEGCGRVVAEVRDPLHRDRVTADVLRQIAPLLAPGDVIVSRHDRALSNLFLPGYWPHAALHVGPPGATGLDLPAGAAARWVDPLHVLEARKDGVLLRPLHDTLAVDSFTVIRPRLGPPDVGRALAAALRHEGKAYNFDFDFFTDGRLVCTEVVYRAYEGIGGIEFPLARRGGRLTLSAEDILDLAVEERGFETVAVFGTPNVGDRLVTGPEAGPALAASYRGAAG